MNGMFTMDFFGTGLKTMAMLAIVLGFLILILYGIKRISFSRRSMEADTRIDVLSTLHLSPKQRIAVVEVAARRILLGITPNNISFLMKIENFDETKDGREKPA